MFPEYLCYFIWSQSTKTVIIGEQTIPAEENVADAHNRKATKYESLIASCISQGWRTTLFPLKLAVKALLVFRFASSARSSVFLKERLETFPRRSQKLHYGALI